MAMSHDCRMCLCVRCYPWDEGTHNFRHAEGYVTERACDCTVCTRDRPLYAGYQPIAAEIEPTRARHLDDPARSWETPISGIATPATA